MPYVPAGGEKVGVFTVPIACVVAEDGSAIVVLLTMSLARTAKKYVVAGLSPVTLKLVDVVEVTVLPPPPKGVHPPNVGA